eukprot:Phypoly_transcript_09184.p1 GENE.Phypoly_transcript_09184~~Phypoly_transcript_09184.p1  ORF type:complete len:170 (-),score=18.03 Phypoly_transcript_09184:109-618(-)
MENLTVEVAGGLAAIPAKVLSCRFSPTLPDHLNVYLRGFHDYQAMLEFPCDITIQGVGGRKDTVLIHKKHLSATSCPTVVRLFVGRLPHFPSESGILERIRNVAAMGDFAPYDVFAFALGRSKGKSCDNKPASYGFFAGLGPHFGRLPHCQRNPNPLWRNQSPSSSHQR